ncbi:putative L-ascorbate peroxidase 6 isoform X1 [Papaver somniferum]|uniref:putative L-ascorbate peroxidase 6 isoform X1 n=1 Tax=Papaver somniferum TaxID=3469 RepID=UPI000E6F9003|nr:putative L-ascorbate peroxidase 6 isoform X1 [Papaver somniferum]
MTTRFDSSFLFSINHLSSSLQFKTPAIKGKIIQFKSGGKVIEASSSPSLSTSSSSARNINNEIPSVNGFGDSVLYRRRAVIIAATVLLPLIGFNGFGVQAAELVTDKTLVIREGVRKALTKGKAAGVLRLVFHDAGTFDMNEKSGGMNGSIVYELDRPENAGLKKSVKILEKVKSELDGTEPVSWADLIAVAGAEAVSLCGGPLIPVQLGRKDLTVPDPEGKLPEETLNASALKRSFLSKGFSTQELVALSGAHTIGGKGFGSPTVFDNSYYKILLEKPWASSANMIGLPSDHVLVEDEECLRWINTYADDQRKFFEDFKNAYIKLVNSGAMWKDA